MPGQRTYQHKIYQNSNKILRFLTISTDFLIVFLSKYSEENFQKSVQPAATKYFVWKFLRFSNKNWWVQNFHIFVRKFLRAQIYLDRIEPRLYSTEIFVLKQYGLNFTNLCHVRVANLHFSSCYSAPWQCWPKPPSACESWT